MDVTLDGPQGQVDYGPVWVLTPLEGVGPLRFGMSPAAAAAALPGVVQWRRFDPDPYSADVGIELAFRAGQPAVYVYFRQGRGLFCVAADAVHGPQVELNGTELVGHDPKVMDEWLFSVPPSVAQLAYGPRGNPGFNELGLVLRVQKDGERWASRPVMVGRAWADRCVDDWEGAIPECEWMHWQWPQFHLRDTGPLLWPSPDHTPRWMASWSPPF